MDLFRCPNIHLWVFPFVSNSFILLLHHFYTNLPLKDIKLYRDISNLTTPKAFNYAVLSGYIDLYGFI